MSSRPAVRQLGRISEIAQVAAKHGFGYLFETRGPAAVRSRRGREVELEGGGSPRGQRLREMLDELGPTFVKFGQLLSTRPDIVPPDVVFELKALQDSVSPFPFDQAREVVESDLGLTLEQLYLEFDETPIAAASIGQVHRAVLPNGRRVVVKVQRPNAPRQIEADLELMYQLARLARERVRALEFIDTVAVVDEFARSIRQELDYRIEARNAEQFHKNFAGHPHVRVPRVFWSYSRSRVLTLELLEGVQVRDIDVARYTMEERRRLAYRIAETWMAMIFRHGFFHADPHPANILVLEQTDQIGLVDFGTAGQLAPDDSSKLTGLFIDVVNQNVEAIPRRLASVGVRYPKDKEEEFVVELRAIFDRYYGASLSEIDPIQVIREAFALIYRMHLTLPTRFILLDRAIATLGSVGRRALPGLQRLRGREAVRARADDRALHAAASRRPHAERGAQLRDHDARAPVPGARRPPGSAGRPDRGGLSPRGPRGPDPPHGHGVQPHRHRHGRRRRRRDVGHPRGHGRGGPQAPGHLLDCRGRAPALDHPEPLARLGRPALREAVTATEAELLERAVALARANVDAGEEPFGSLVVRDGEVLGEGVNTTARDADPTAHAEVAAVREACRRLGTIDLGRSDRRDELRAVPDVPHGRRARGRDPHRLRGARRGGGELRVRALASRSRDHGRLAAPGPARARPDARAPRSRSSASPGRSAGAARVRCGSCGRR